MIGAYWPVSIIRTAPTPAECLVRALVLGFIQTESCSMGICTEGDYGHEHHEVSVGGIHAYINTMVDLGKWTVSEASLIRQLLPELFKTVTQIVVPSMAGPLGPAVTPQASAQCPVTLKEDLIQIAELQKRSMGLELPHYLLN